MIERSVADNHDQLAFAVEMVAAFRAVYGDHVKSRGMTKKYKIKDREMEFSDLSEILKQLKFWQGEVARLEAVIGIRPSPGRMVRMRFR